ncbi:MAG: redoxin domain-containing protein [Candidatus Sulfobium sp.]
MVCRRRFFPFALTAVIIAVVTCFAYSVNAQALLQTGKEAPGFTLKDLEGNRTTLSQYAQKKAVVLLFWSTWSANSKKALKRFEAFHQKYPDKEIQILGINADNQTISTEDVENIRKTVQETGITFPVLLDRGLEAFHTYGVIAIPSTIVIMEGRIAYELPGLPLVGTEDLFDYLRELAGEKPRSKTEPRYRPRYDAIADASLAKGFAKEKMNAMAYPFFKKAIDKDPKYMLPYVGLARLYEADGNPKAAEATLRKALSIDGGNVVVMSELGCLLTKTGKTQQALDILSSAAKKDSYTPSHYYYAYALGKAGKFTESLAAFDKALSLNPFEVTIYRLRAEIYEDNKMLKEASADYRKALELTLKIDPAIVRGPAPTGPR